MASEQWPGSEARQAIASMKWSRLRSCTSTRRLRQLLVCVFLLATLSLLFLIVSLFSFSTLLFQTAMSHAHVIPNGLPSESNGEIHVHSRDGSSLTEPKPAFQAAVHLAPTTQSSTDAVWSPTTEALSSSTVTTHRHLITSWKTTRHTANSSWNIYTPTKRHAVLQVNKSETEETAVTTPRPLSTSRVTHRKSLPTVPKKRPPICIIDNCGEFLSFRDVFAVNRCRKNTLKHPGVIHVQKGTCRFLSDHSRQPVALVSPEGSGNMWLRGLLERSTGICTGFSYCDYEARARGFAGEGVNSGHVLVVKTHSAPTQWIGNEGKVKWEGQYDSAVFLIRNPARSLIAEWNRRMSNKLKKDTSHFHPDFNDSHTYVVSEDFFCKFICPNHIDKGLLCQG